VTDVLPTSERRLGALIIGFGGAVATTVVAGIELVRSGHAATTGLPLADATAAALVAYGDIAFGG